MTTAAVPPSVPGTPTWQPDPAYAAPLATAPPTNGSILRHWPTWAQNTALLVGAVAVLVVVFFAGFVTANAVNAPSGVIGTGQEVGPQQFWDGGQSGSGGQSGPGQQWFGSQGGQGEQGGQSGQSTPGGSGATS